LESHILAEIRRTWPTFEKLFATGADPTTLETDLALRVIWGPAREWSRRQLEETFCDAVGVRLFGESYFHAMEYLISPHFQNRRSIYYPAIRSRIDAITKAATAFGVPSPIDFFARFSEQPLRLDLKQDYLLQISDHATDSVVADAVAAAGIIADKAGIASPVSNEVVRIHECFKAGIPAHGLRNLADIINAGWKEYMSILGDREPTALQSESVLPGSQMLS
jgi:hypothetical protein